MSLADKVAELQKQENVETETSDERVIGSSSNGGSGGSDESLFEEETIEIKRCNVVTGICLIRDFNVQEVSYNESHLEFANSESKFLYEGRLISRKEGYNIRFEIVNSRMVNIDYRANDMELRKALLDAINEVYKEFAQEFDLDEKELNVRACL